MAKDKITLKEKLEEAIVKDAPYEVPGNWVWVNSLNIFNVEYGKNLPTKNLIGKGYPVFGANGYIGFFNNYNVDKDKVLISCRGAYSGNVNIAVENSFVTNNSLIISQKDERITNSFLFYMLKAMDRKNLVSGTAQPQVTVKAFESFDIVLPPLKEQQRIVDKIESLFQKLDRAKDLIDEARDDFEKRKSAILEKAFRGELTKEWRKRNKISSYGANYLSEISKMRIEIYNKLLNDSKHNKTKRPTKIHDSNDDCVQHENCNTWIKTRLGNILYDFRYGTSSKSDYSFNGMPVIRIPNLSNGYINHDDMKYLKEDYVDDNNRVKTGDIVIVRSNGSALLVGKTSLITELEDNFAFASYLIRMRPCKVNPKYLYYVLNSISVKEQFYSKSKSTSGINNINTEELGNSIIPLPPLEEQKEIVRILDKLLEEESKIEELTQLEGQIELIKKSILAKAFRGELGTNCKEDESAVELLKAILSKA